MSTGTKTCDIVLPGYSLVERIGAGGYAEVWRAEAPGGIQKAVKIVYGYYDDEFASQELKALERIKGVRHPFLLSLERFEVISGRLTILTELADMSLEQRLRQCRAGGLSGIPRDELLQYVADTAEALDFLSQRHQLLHLDIKPENLLILGDHIKVADFGLVKELATRTQNSLVSGMTPTYASPEMFDDEPSAFSDQYSLAIVYQEMLVGALAFPGRTAAQLAKQHTQAEPQLMALPAEDRPAVARALAKAPEDRFPTCRSFVDALTRRATVSTAAAPIELPPPTPRSPSSDPGPDDTRSHSFCTTLRRTPEQAQEKRAPLVTQPVVRDATPSDAPPAQIATPTEPVDMEETVDVPVPESSALLDREQPTLYVAVGGAGIQVLCQMRALVASRAATDDPFEAVESVALDTNRDELREACSSRWKKPLVAEDILHLPLRLPKSYDDSRGILGWVSRRWLYNIPRSLETRGFRPLGRIALVDHAQRVLNLLDEKLERLAALAGSNDVGGDVRDAKMRVVLLASTGGGTGAGMVLDLANAVRSLAATRGLQADIQGFLICTCFGNFNSSPLATSNTYSFLKELSHATQLGNQGIGSETPDTGRFQSSAAPFDCVYFVPTRIQSGNARVPNALDILANYLAQETTPAARGILRACRASHTPREQRSGGRLTLKKLGYASLADQKHELVIDLAANLAEAIKRHWLQPDTSADWERIVRKELRAASAAKQEATSEEDPSAPPTPAPAVAATPLALRGRFKEHLSLAFASGVMREVQRQMDGRDDRVRPVLLSRDAERVIDAAYAAVDTLAASVTPESDAFSRVGESAEFGSLISAGSQRILRLAVESFDPTQPDRFLPADAIDELVASECQSLLEENLERPDSAAALMTLVDLEQAVANTITYATSDLLQCGSDRRTLLFLPKSQSLSSVADAAKAVRPATAVVPADVDDVVVVSEEAGISPRAFAQGLERLYPGIADAARRLHTRIDVEWQGLN